MHREVDLDGRERERELDKEKERERQTNRNAQRSGLEGGGGVSDPDLTLNKNLIPIQPKKTNCCPFLFP